jgi:hypothetical protein
VVRCGSNPIPDDAALFARKASDADACQSQSMASGDLSLITLFRVGSSFRGIVVRKDLEMVDVADFFSHSKRRPVANQCSHRVTSVAAAGRSPDWIKVKNRKHPALDSKLARDR